MKKWILAVEAQDFSETIWQADDAILTSEELNQVIQDWGSKVQDILLCLAEGKSTDEIIEKLDGDYYPLGDLANFLDNIEIRTLERAGEKNG